MSKRRNTYFLSIIAITLLFMLSGMWLGWNKAQAQAGCVRFYTKGGWFYNTFCNTGDTTLGRNWSSQPASTAGGIFTGTWHTWWYTPMDITWTTVLCAQNQ